MELSSTKLKKLLIFQERTYRTWKSNKKYVSKKFFASGDVFVILTAVKRSLIFSHYRNVMQHEINKSQQFSIVPPKLQESSKNSGIKCWDILRSILAYIRESNISWHLLFQSKTIWKPLLNILWDLVKIWLWVALLIQGYWIKEVLPELKYNLLVLEQWKQYKTKDILSATLVRNKAEVQTIDVTQLLDTNYFFFLNYLVQWHEHIY